MRKLYLKQISSNNLKIANTIRNEQGESQYLVIGNFAKIDSFINIYDNIGNLLVEFKQTSFGFLPKFTITFNGRSIGTIGLSLGVVLDLIYIRELNWLITGRLTTGTYHAYFYQEKIMSVSQIKKSTGLYNELIVKNILDEPILIGICVILNRWLFNLKLNGLNVILPKSNNLAYLKKYNLNTKK